MRAESGVHGFSTAEANNMIASPAVRGRRWESAACDQLVVVWPNTIETSETSLGCSI